MYMKQLQIYDKAAKFNFIHWLVQIPRNLYISIEIPQKNKIKNWTIEMHVPKNPTDSNTTKTPKLYCKVYLFIHNSHDMCYVAFYLFYIFDHS